MAAPDELEAIRDGVRAPLFLTGLGVALLFALTLGVLVAHIPSQLAWSFGVAGSGTLLLGLSWGAVVVDPPWMRRLGELTLVSRRATDR